MAEPIGKAAAHAPDQRAEFRSRPAIAAIQDELDRLSLIQQPAEGPAFAGTGETGAAAGGVIGMLEVSLAARTFTFFFVGIKQSSDGPPGELA